MSNNSQNQLGYNGQNCDGCGDPLTYRNKGDLKGFCVMCCYGFGGGKNSATAVKREAKQIAARKAVR